MKSILNQLIQLQELNFAKEEQKASNSQMPLAQLEKSIAKIRGQLPPDVADPLNKGSLVVANGFVFPERTHLKTRLPKF